LDLLQKIGDVIDAVNERAGKAVSLLVLAMIGLLCWEVLVRYVFDSPTIWAHEITVHIFGAYAILGGAYVLLLGGHVRMDLVYKRLPPKGRVCFDFICLLLFWLVIGTILVEGLEFAQRSIALREVTFTAFASPIYPVKSTIPVAAFLMLIQGTAQYIKTIAISVRKMRELS
jgi:TRAP-type mannitol/chloroaromatic compound transport system permease small subunit